MIEQTNAFDKRTLERERVLLVGVQWAKMRRWEIEDHLAELTRLVETAGGDVVFGVIQERSKPHVATFIGSGKIEEIQALIADLDVDIVVFDDSLSPAQHRNLEKAFSKKVVDRAGLILDIFSQRARTKAGKLQVELAQYQYIYPRLIRMWSHLDRQGGGIGTRGPGETELETDRRIIQERIRKLKRELTKVERHRDLHRSSRRRSNVPVIALVGYTNAGKSTLFNQMTGAEAYSQDQLFATLDPTVRRLSLGEGEHFPVLITDTVGFIRKLPHQLIDAFKSTLEEVREANLIVHVVDTPHPHHKEQIEVVDSVLEELGCGETPSIRVYNKADILSDDQKTFCGQGSLLVSALTGEGVMDLRDELLSFFRQREDQPLQSEGESTSFFIAP